MFFKPTLFAVTAKKLFAYEGTQLCSAPASIAAYLAYLKRTRLSGGNTGTPIETIRFHRGFPRTVRERVEAVRPISSDAYAICLSRTTTVYAATDAACVHAMITLCCMQEEGSLGEGFLYDAPLVPERGYRTYLPARAKLAEFEEMLDLLAKYKYNSIMLEIGGAMEYDRHPEIAKTWFSFCREMRKASGKTFELQHQYPWPKNSIHCDNAEGDVLTKEECRRIAALCRERGIEVIPECPTFSHCDYLVMAHPELREREGDGHPDSYCPRHPDTYRYVFDILEEVIEVFAPRRINIGHDEAYTVGLCPRCKGTPAPQLYAEDANRIRDFLAARGVGTMMWGEKLLNARTGKGFPVGGAGHGEGSWHIPALYPSRDLLSRDITFLHWYWPFNEKYDNVFHDRGMPVVYGNLSAFSVKKWDMRLKRGIRGGFVGNWGSFNEEYMQRNQQYFDLIAAAYGFYHNDFESQGKEALLAKILDEAFRLKCAKMQHPLYITHETTYNVPYEYFYDGIFIVEEKYLLGHYVLRYDDGTEAFLPVRFGTHIGCRDYPDAMNQGGFRQTSYGTLPQQCGECYVYKTVYEDPHPEKMPVSVCYRPLAGKEHIKVSLLSFEAQRNFAPLYTERPTLDWGDEFAMDGGKV